MLVSETTLFLDANILLDWAYTSRSWAQQAVHKVLEHKWRLVTSNEALREAHKQIDEVIPIVARRELAHQDFENRIRSLPLAMVSDPPSYSFDTFKDISHTDQYLLRVCLANDLTLLTSDGPLRLACAGHGVRAFVPIELLNDLAPSFHSLSGPNYECERGAVVFCGALSHFPGAKEDTFFEVLRVDDDFFLLANPGRNIWRLKVRDALTNTLLSVDTAIANLEGNFAFRKVGASWSDGRLLLIDFHTHNTDELLIQNGLFVGNGIMQFAKSQHFRNWPQLLIKAAMRDNRPIGRATRRLMRDSPWFIMPHPFDKDRLKLAVRAHLSSLN